MKTSFLKSLMRVLALVVLVVVPSVSRADVVRGDVDGDGYVSINDVATLINYLLKGVWPDEPVIPADEHEWVDLGLPSGTLWATYNVGANSPEEYGDYFAWGETASKDYYDWNTYKWCNGDIRTLTKYCTLSYCGYNGFVDNKTELDPEDDAAYVNWGTSWRMPSLEQMQELFNKCTSWRTTLNGVNGLLFTGPNGNTLFLPSAGYRLRESLLDAVLHGYYWSRTLDSGMCYPYYLGWSGCESHVRCWGRSVRAVRVSRN